jgi:large subunit ribosomal protein L6
MPAKAAHFESSTPILEGTTVQVDGKRITVQGPKGTLARDFSHADVAIERKGKAIVISVEYPRSRQIALVGTLISLVDNMMLGVLHGVVYKMKIVFAHFPPSVKVAGDKVTVENFYGEKSMRKAQILPGVTVQVGSDEVVVEGIDITQVAQTAANIQAATRLRRKDPRKFQDGIYVFEKRIGERVWNV